MSIRNYYSVTIIRQYGSMQTLDTAAFWRLKNKKQTHGMSYDILTDTLTTDKQQHCLSHKIARLSKVIWEQAA